MKKFLNSLIADNLLDRSDPHKAYKLDTSRLLNVACVGTSIYLVAMVALNYSPDTVEALKTIMPYSLGGQAMYQIGKKLSK